MSQNNSSRLEQIALTVKRCRRCPLFRTAAHGVPGEGDPQAKMFFIGEAPGAREDETGLPFVGNSGKLLDKLLNSIGLDRDAVFIGNVVKHRPPGNRDPHPSEIKACMPYLEGQLKVIKPRVVISLGRFATNIFLPNVKISQVHGKCYSITWQNLKILLIPLYHPAAALRNGTMKQALIDDFYSLKKYL